MSIDTVTVVDAEGLCDWPCTCGDDGYPALNLDTGLELRPRHRGSAPEHGGHNPVLWLRSGRWAPLEAGQPLDRRCCPMRMRQIGHPGRRTVRQACPPVGLDMNTLDSGFADSDCGSPVERTSAAPGQEPPGATSDSGWSRPLHLRHRDPRPLVMP